MIKYYTSILFLSLCCLFAIYLVAQNNNSNTIQQVQKLPKDYPTFKETGDPAKDEQRWIEQKSKWIEKNPEKYEAMGGILSVEETEEEYIPPKIDLKAKMQDYLPLEDAQKWVLKELKAIDKSKEQKYDTEQVRLEALYDFPLKRTAFYQHDDCMILDRSNERIHFGSVEKKDNHLTWILGIDDCENCGKIMKMKIVEDTDKHFIVLLPDEDNALELFYQLHFVKK